jgi:hypothetical protein
MSDIATYLTEVELALVSSSVVAEYHIVCSWANTDDGYIRVRATLTNGDFLEAAEYFALDRNRIVTIDYHHQWMDSDKKGLQRRWDSTPHYPHLENFPHHIHIGDEETVSPGHPTSLIDLLKTLENELSQP